MPHVFSITEQDLSRMRTQLLFDGADRAAKFSRFWTLLVLAGVIASAGIIADSTATVIGAMIVAPLMTPILGTVLSVVTGDYGNLARSLALVVTGSAAVVLIGLLFGYLIPVDVVASTNAQVAGRVHPRLIDLIAALATGAVGAFAMVRSDVSDTLPGVAIAISLVPPLAVVGLTLEAGAEGQSVGALLLFLTNVGAILLTGLFVMTLYRVRLAEPRSERHVSGRVAGVLVTAFVAVLAVPLALSGARITSDSIDQSRVAAVASDWAGGIDWEITSVESTAGGIEVRATGGLPLPDPARLRADLAAAGLEHTHVIVVLTPSRRADLDELAGDG
jgi:uncharacterized hydrophobic protein (TIGR00271 family)